MEIVAARAGGERHVLSLAAAVERGSTHPLARAIAARAAQDGIEPPTPNQVEAIPGRGIKARVDGALVILGTSELMRQAGLDASAFDERVAGFHVWGERRFGRVNAVGALVGSFEHPEPGTPRDAEYALFFTRRVAEPVRLRVQVSQFDSEEASDELRVALQLTAYLGSHVHGPRDG